MKPTIYITISLLSIILYVAFSWHVSAELKKAAKVNGALSYKLELTKWMDKNDIHVSLHQIDSAVYANYEIQVP